jgi:hypothetical protein
MPPLKAPEFTKLAHQRLDPTLKAWGFKRTRKASPASWCRPEGGSWLVFWFQPRSSNDAYSAGYRFTLEFLLGPEPEIYGGGFRRRFPTLLTDAGKEQLRLLENQAIAKLPPPNMAFIGQLPESTREHVLEGWRPRITPYGADEDVWMRQGSEDDVEALLEFITAELPGVIVRFLSAARAESSS